MAASLARSGARRLAAGSSAVVQRAPAAGALIQRRRPFAAARFMTTSSTRQQHDRPHPESLAKAKLVEKIQLKKEELYYLISLTETGIHTNSYNRQLLRSLSAQIKPRPRDHRWHFIRASKRRSDVIRPVGIVLGFFIGAYAVLLMRGLDAARMEEEEISQTASIKEQQQAKAANNKEIATLAHRG